MPHECRIPFGSMTWDTPAAGVRSKAHAEGGRRLRLLELGPEFVEPEWCQKGHIGYVLEGELEIDFGGRLVTFRAGDGLWIPPGDAHKHKARALTERVVLILVEEAD